MKPASLRHILLAAVATLGLALPAQAEWRRGTSRHFILYSQGSSNDLKQTLTAMERYDQLLRLLSINKPDEDSAPLPIFMVANADQVGDLITRAASPASTRSAR